MNVIEDKGLRADEERLEQAVEWFLRVRSENASLEDLPELRRWIESDPDNALAYQQVSSAWTTVGEHASAPGIVMGRRDALEDSHRAGRHGSVSPLKAGRWVAAACVALVALGTGAWWVFSPHWTEYSTPLGQQRTVTLADESVIVLDAHSRVRVRYTEKERAIALEEGQARFSVAKDPLRPFRVRARDQTVVALGTQFDVELISKTVLVTLIEGHVAVGGVTSQPPRTAGSANTSGQAAARASGQQVIELTAGEGLRVHEDGRAVLLPNVDLTRATAWQKGRVSFDNEPLSAAVERINRYARQQVEVDPSVAAVGISGVFNSGDTAAFIEAVTTYFPVEAIRNRGANIYLTRRN
ncbi:MAG: FecR domain-containing protein [Gammaproteobacteria bacterium]